ncbi:hypothetical protein B0675_39910 [Streptomyces sp. M41(2017)]|uniref:hypothetical protein n=1 Tax=Streptomyces sp. M41(2017) TaxID=1955065 RepID=UPI0009C127F7|nr:hypothetical protein [Streptomyces sp. M41(2017)]OQQ12985.1 hypothetical protein B0675_39910 [Streptomyces sp. M41(2017)]
MSGSNIAGCVLSVLTCLLGLGVGALGVSYFWGDLEHIIGGIGLIICAVGICGLSALLFWICRNAPRSDTASVR